MNVGAILDYVAGEIDAQVLGYMQKYNIPPSLMDKTLDRVQSHVRQLKSEEYAEEMVTMELKRAETRTGTVKEFKEAAGIEGADENADV